MNETKPKSLEEQLDEAWDRLDALFKARGLTVKREEVEELAALFGNAAMELREADPTP